MSSLFQAALHLPSYVCGWLGGTQRRNPGNATTNLSERENRPISDLRFTCNQEQALYMNVQRFRGGLVFKAHELLYHSTLGSRVLKKRKRRTMQVHPHREREFFFDNLLVRIHLITEMIWWTGLAPWVFEFPFPGSLTSTFLGRDTSAYKSRLAFSSDRVSICTSDGDRPSILCVFL